MKVLVLIKDTKISKKKNKKMKNYVVRTEMSNINNIGNDVCGPWSHLGPNNDKLTAVSGGHKLKMALLCDFFSS
jgi:hypothetical protein